MNVEQLNGWISLTAIAVNVQDEIEAFQNFRLIEGISSACLNRIKVVTTIALFALSQLAMALNSCYLLVEGQVSFVNFAKIMAFGTTMNLANISLGFFALPFTELVLQASILNPLCQLNDSFTPYLMAGLKNIDMRNFEKRIWEIAEKTRDDLLDKGLLSKDDLQVCDPIQIQFLVRATVLRMFEEWEIKSSVSRKSQFKPKIYLGQKGQSEIWELSFSSKDVTPQIITEIGSTLQQAIENFAQLNDQQKEILEDLLLEDKKIEDEVSPLSDEDQETILSLFHDAGIIEHVLTSCLLNAHKDFELIEKAKQLFMCDE